MRAARGRAGEVGVALGLRQALRRALDAHRAVDLQPAEGQRGVGVRGQGAPLGRVVVGVEAEAALVEPAQQDVARGRAPVGVDRRHRHRLGLVDPGFAGGGEPGAELLDGVGGRRRRDRGAGPRSRGVRPRGPLTGARVVLAELAELAGRHAARCRRCVPPPGAAGATRWSPGRRCRPCRSARAAGVVAWPRRGARRRLALRLGLVGRRGVGLVGGGGVARRARRARRGLRERVGARRRRELGQRRRHDVMGGVVAAAGAQAQARDGERGRPRTYACEREGRGVLGRERRHAPPAGGAVVEIALRELVAPGAEAQVLDGPRQARRARAAAAGRCPRPRAPRRSRGRV